MGPTLRAARPEDALQIARIHVTSWREGHVGIAPQPYLDSLDISKRASSWSRTIKDRTSRVIVAETMAGIVGFASAGKARAWTGPETGEVFALYVDGRSKGKGTGARLLREAARGLVAEGHAGMMLWVLAKNPSRGFFDHSGGVVSGERKDDVGGYPLDEVAYVWADAAAFATQD